MTARHEVPPRGSAGRGLQRSVEWMLGIVGGIALLMGLFIRFAGEDQYVGVGGDLSWRVGDISSTWVYGLTIGGGVLLLLTLALVVADLRSPRPRATGRRADLSGLLWHFAIFVVVNAFLWTQDILVGGGLEYAHWTTIAWGVGLAIHALAYGFGGRSKVEQQPLEEAVSEHRELQPH